MVVAPDDVVVFLDGADVAAVDVDVVDLTAVYHHCRNLASQWLVSDTYNKKKSGKLTRSGFLIREECVCSTHTSVLDDPPNFIVPFQISTLQASPPFICSD